MHPRCISVPGSSGIIWRPILELNCPLRLIGRLKWEIDSAGDYMTSGRPPPHLPTPLLRPHPLAPFPTIRTHYAGMYGGVILFRFVCSIRCCQQTPDMPNG